MPDFDAKLVARAFVAAVLGEPAARKHLQATREVDVEHFGPVIEKILELNHHLTPEQTREVLKNVQSLLVNGTEDFFSLFSPVVQRLIRCPR